MRKVEEQCTIARWFDTCKECGAEFESRDPTTARLVAMPDPEPRCPGCKSKEALALLQSRNAHLIGATIFDLVIDDYVLVGVVAHATDGRDVVLRVEPDWDGGANFVVQEKR